MFWRKDHFFLSIATKRRSITADMTVKVKPDSYWLNLTQQDLNVRTDGNSGDSDFILAQQSIEIPQVRFTQPPSTAAIATAKANVVIAANIVKNTGAAGTVAITCS